MYAKSITYTDYDGNERTETFHFHLKESELVELNVSEQGGLEKMVERITAEQDAKKTIELFKKIILLSYGKKSDDGKRHIKNDEIRAEFEETEAFSNLFMELFTNSDAAIEFINGILPKKLQDSITAEGSNLKEMVQNRITHEKNQNGSITPIGAHNA